MDKEKAAYWYKKAADNGESRGMNNLGEMYRTGQGVEINYEEAFRLYQEAAKDKDNCAIYNMGECYEHGQGVEKNMEKALEMYRQAAELGDSSACCAMGRFCEYGILMEIDMNKAVEWYTKGADSKNKDEEALYRLALCYAEGKGVAQDEEKARELCRRAWPENESEKEGIRNDFFNAPNDLSQVLSSLKELLHDEVIGAQLDELVEYLKTTPVKK